MILGTLIPDVNSGYENICQKHVLYIFNKLYGVKSWRRKRVSNRYFQISDSGHYLMFISLARFMNVFTKD